MYHSLCMHSIVLSSIVDSNCMLCLIVLPFCTTPFLNISSQRIKYNNHNVLDTA